MKCCICGENCDNSKYVLQAGDNELPICRACNYELEHLKIENDRIVAFDSLYEKLRSNTCAEVNIAVEARFWDESSTT